MLLMSKSIWVKRVAFPQYHVDKPPLSVFRTQETEKTEKKFGKRKKPKKKERLEEEAEEEAGEEVEGGWEKVKGGAPLVKVKKI